VLASWAVPKGPTLAPSVRRQAIHVEDHPLEYYDFEGVIPQGEYGGGDVIVWDWGQWIPAKGADPAQAIDEGELHFDLDGEKLHGRFVLIRPHRSPRSGSKEAWLLLHKDDDAAVAGWDPEALPLSVKSGRTNEQVAAAPDVVWRSGVPAAEATERLRPEIPTWEPPNQDELDALDALGKEGQWHLQGQVLRLTYLDKPLFPARKQGSAVTKRDLIRYAARIGPWLLPYLHDRPVNLHRYPTASTSSASGTRRSRPTHPTGSPGGTTTRPTPASGSTARSNGAPTSSACSPTRPRRQQPLTAAVSLVRARAGALVAAGADVLGRLRVDEPPATRARRLCGSRRCRHRRGSRPAARSRQTESGSPGLPPRLELGGSSRRSPGGPTSMVDPASTPLPGTSTAGAPGRVGPFRARRFACRPAQAVAATKLA
jgi:DNA ligase D-like protein (predicted 3'-phosphoesterase)